VHYRTKLANRGYRQPCNGPIPHPRSLRTHTLRIILNRKNPEDLIRKSECSWGPACLLPNRYQGHFLRVKRPGCEVHHSPPSSAEVKEYVKLYLNSPNTPSWRGAQLKHRNNFTFTLDNDQLTRVSLRVSETLQWTWLIVRNVTVDVAKCPKRYSGRG
jgi:hypothetical protein